MRSISPGQLTHGLGRRATFSDPKSLSLLASSLPPDQARALLSAHEDAVRVAMRFMEIHGGLARTALAGDDYRMAGGLVTTSFHHTTSRSLDPDTHTHVLVWNLLQLPNGQYRCIDQAAIAQASMATAAIYRAELRARAVDLGLTFSPTGKRGLYEAEGIPSRILRAFSRRREEICEIAGESASYAARQVATVSSRTTKVAVEWEDLRGETEARLAALGHPVAYLRRLVSPPTSHGVRKLTPARTPRKKIAALVEALMGPEGLTAQRAAFTLLDLYRSVADALPEGMAVSDVEATVESLLSDPKTVPMVVKVFRPEEVARNRNLPTRLLRRGTKLADHALVLERAPAGTRKAPSGAACRLRFTSTDILEMEDQVLTYARRRLRGPLTSPKLAERAIRFGKLFSDQEAVVRQVCTSTAAISLIDGWAGSGKTRTLRTLTQALTAGGHQVLGAAPTGAAAYELSAGANIAASTLDSLLSRLQTGSVKLTDRSVIVVDEASLLSTRNLARLVEQASRQSARIVLVGSTIQLPSVETGGLFRLMAKVLGAANLHTNRRQVHPWERDALTAIHQGRIGEAVHAYDQAGRIFTGGSVDELLRVMVSRWANSVARGIDARILTLTIEDRDRANQLAHWARLRELSGPTITLESTQRWSARSANFSKAGREILHARPARSPRRDRRPATASQQPSVPAGRPRPMPPSPSCGALHASSPAPGWRCPPGADHGG